MRQLANTDSPVASLEGRIEVGLLRNSRLLLESRAPTVNWQPQSILARILTRLEVPLEAKIFFCRICLEHKQ